MRVRVEDQDEDAKLIRQMGGESTLILRAGLISSRAYVALTLALSPLVEHGDQYLHHAG